MVLMAFLMSAGCQKGESFIGDNVPPNYNVVPTVVLENYINRIFIDMIGREPSDSEMENEVLALRDGDLAPSARRALIKKLQTNQTFIEGDTSYAHAYSRNMYNLAKTRFMEGYPDREIGQEINNLNRAALVDSLNGNYVSAANFKRRALNLQEVIDSRGQFRTGSYHIKYMFAAMVNNDVYDDINMNSFNFVIATFDNLLWRQPTNAEFLVGYDMVENNVSGALLGSTGTNKGDYVRIFRESSEMHQGIVIWVFQQLLARRPNTAETLTFLPDLFSGSGDIREIQQTIMTTDEYANF